MWLRHIWHWLRQCSIWLRQIYPPRIWCMFLLPKFLIIWLKTFFFTSRQKLVFFLHFLPNFVFLRFSQNLTCCGTEKKFGQLHLVKLHLANFIWPTSFGETSFGVKRCCVLSHSHPLPKIVFRWALNCQY